MALLQTFAPGSTELGVNELARLHGMHPSSVSRLMMTLAEAKLVRVDSETGRYRLGLGLLELSHVLLSGYDVRAAARDIMRELARSAQETVNLSILDGTQAVIVDQVPVASGVAFVSWIGRRVPIHATSHGKLHLAFLDDSDRERILSAVSDKRGHLPKITSRTRGTVGELREDIVKARRQGYATNRGELNADASGLSAPIFGASGDMVAALVVAGPSSRITQRRQIELAPLVMDAARRISIEMGWSGSGEAKSPDSISTLRQRAGGTHA